MRVKNSNFVDYVKIFCRSGKGGAGSSHFLRDKSTSKGETNVEKVKMTIDEDQWEQLEGLVAAINLARINTLEVPSKKFQFDGDLATTLNVNVNDTVYTSSTFDKKNPPEEIAALVNYIYSLKKE